MLENTHGKIGMNGMVQWFHGSFGRTGVFSAEASLVRFITAGIVLLTAYLISRVLQRIAERRLSHGDQSDDGAIRAYKNIIRVVVLVPGTLVAIHMMGVNLSSVFTTGGLFAVALAFALKNLAENFAAGIMLRFERAIKPGDILESEGTLVRVKKIGLRATIARSKDERDLLIPNSQLVGNRVANYTYQDVVCRVPTVIGVSYDSDPGMVREVLEGVCFRMEGKSDQHEPTVLLTKFGSSSVDYQVYVWTADPWGAGKFRSTLNEAIWQALNDANIKMAFPQLDVHFDSKNQKNSLRN